MRKITIILVALCLLMSGCGAPAGIHSSAPSNVQGRPALAPISLEGIALGMTPAELMNWLDKNELAIDMPDYNEFPIPDDVTAPKDGRVYNIADYSFYYTLKDYRLHFTFTDEGLIIVSCFDSKVTTPKGLKVGDSITNAKKLYGDTDAEADPRTYLKYSLNGGFLIIFLEDDAVTNWLFSKYEDYGN